MSRGAAVTSALGYAFRDARLLLQARTHRSVGGLAATTTPAAAAAARPGSALARLVAEGLLPAAAPPANNERLEFLVDSVLGAVVAG